MLANLIEALVIGFSYGLGPCTLTCAPVVVPLISSIAKNKREGILFVLIFGLARLITYTILGFLAGLTGYELKQIVPKPVIGIVIITLGIALLFGTKARCPLKIRGTGPLMLVVAGVAMALTPCPPLIGLLGLAILSNSSWIGALMGFVFGIGSIISPLIVLGFMAGWFAKQKEFKSIVPYVSGVFLILFGIVYIFSL